jgi:hypothetical protein
MCFAWTCPYLHDWGVQKARALRGSYAKGAQCGILCIRIVQSLRRDLTWSEVSRYARARRIGKIQIKCALISWLRIDSFKLPNSSGTTRLERYAFV